MQVNTVFGCVQMLVRLLIVALTISACEDRGWSARENGSHATNTRSSSEGVNRWPVACQDSVDLRGEVRGEVLDYFKQVAFATGRCPSMRPLDDLSVMCGRGLQFEISHDLWYAPNRSGPRYFDGGDPFIDGDEFVRACRWGRELRRSVERQNVRLPIDQRIRRGFDALMYVGWRADARRAAQPEGNTRAIGEREACMRIALMAGPGPYWRNGSRVNSCLALPQKYISDSRQHQLEDVTQMVDLWTGVVVPKEPWLYTAANSASIPSWVWRSP